MHQYSERQQILRDLFMMLIFLHQQETDDLLDSTINIPVLPSLGRIAAPENPGRALLLDVMFDDESMVSDLLHLVLSSRYLHTRLPPRLRDEFDLAQLFDMRDEDFKQAQQLLTATANPSPISTHSRKAWFKRNLCVGRGTVVKASRRVIRAINDLSEKYLMWPDEVRRKEVSDVMKCEGFEGCVGFVDGTTIPLYQRPSIDGEVFFDQKKHYSINCQVVCDCDRFITAYMTGWPGSCGNSMVFKRMMLHKEPTLFFDRGQYLIADSAYELGVHCIPAYKAPAAYIKDNSDFNYCLARSRVRNEHTIGILKGRWASLQHLRLAIQKPSDMMEVIRWVNCCVTLHSILAHLGDAWDALEAPGIDHLASEGTGINEDTANEDTAKEHREVVQAKCLDINYSLGVLPI
ncbi:uncharacterized protein PGTG_06191 [Puccinia graminis f. sp. tritici CRL 75-36-700-3]|uniref:DDE Tnp4 domain-containing protein n=1 Tax=Puccinia graminis f. sp. tritici (strain CRL 75-36-700-3 / race SCCL) TaxID=418459 RepID=E3K829_PUCGT|nr:uncharacterized protein PGTG_06191 [Puccinia graminis f. sp. tritici CRL 75-36-700-3]EFP80235.2 hypothetical protein PGTG_06191 [Puccinia graminis f. sp. tritici CRL 75-36-700-3]